MMVVNLVGARPQFIKAAVVGRALRKTGVDEALVHTGQHYDDRMSRVFFDELGIPEPVANLGVGSGSHAGQTGRIMIQLEEWIVRAPRRASAIVVYGDTNSTLGAALVASKLGLPIAHVEAGLRSYNRRMPEEVNRIVTDRLSDTLFCPSHLAVSNLAREGMTEGVVFSGDVMYDATLEALKRAEEHHPLASIAPAQPGEYVLVTVHRAENTDDRARLEGVLRALEELTVPAVWPMHPRTRQQVSAYGLTLPRGVIGIEPVGYLAMQTLIRNARRVVTDSGGVQKEAFWLGTPCVTLRAETEWPETLESGWNRLVGHDIQAFIRALEASPTGPRATPYGDGNAAAHIARHIASRYGTL